MNQILCLFLDEGMKKKIAQLLAYVGCRPGTKILIPKVRLVVLVRIPHASTAVKSSLIADWLSATRNAKWIVVFKATWFSTDSTEGFARSSRRCHTNQLNAARPSSRKLHGEKTTIGNDRKTSWHLPSGNLLAFLVIELKSSCSCVDTFCTASKISDKKQLIAIKFFLSWSNDRSFRTKIDLLQKLNIHHESTCKLRRWQLDLDPRLMSVVVEKKGILLRLNRDSRSEDSPSTRQCLRLSTAPYGFFGKMNFYIANGVFERLKFRLHAW